jgi:hypothetical protein
MDVETQVLMIGADPDVGALPTTELMAAAVRSWADVETVRIEGVGHRLGIENGDVSKLMKSITPFLRKVLEPSTR